jgi:Spy/CpxP family protein refolding chaperone
MKRKWLVPGLILITIINLSALGTLMYNRWGLESKNVSLNDTVSHGCYMKRHLNISDEQVLNLDSSENIYSTKIESMSRQIKEKRSKLVAELLKDKSDTTQIEYILHEIDSLQAVIQRDVVSRLINEKNILTPEQRGGYFSLVLGKLCYEVDSLTHTQCQQQSNNQSKEIK